MALATTFFVFSLRPINFFSEKLLQFGDDQPAATVRQHNYWSEQSYITLSYHH